MPHPFLPELTMTPIEFLYRLKQLPADTQLNIAQLGAAFEMVCSMLKRSKDLQVNAPVGIDSKAALAEWLGEPLATIEGWRTQPESAHYRLAAVLEWIVQHIVPIEKIALSDSEGDADVLGRLSAYLEDWIPCVVIDGRFVGFFRSLEDETLPTHHELLRADVLALEPSKMAAEDIKNVIPSLEALGKFKTEIMTSAILARNTYNQWKDKAMPEVLLQFFKAALGRNEKLACDIAMELDEKLIRKGVNITAWLWEQLVSVGFCRLEHNLVRNAFVNARDLGVPINQNTKIVDARHNVVFHCTASHLLADTTGDTYRLQPIDGCDEEYRGTLTALLDLGLNVDIPNDRELTARKIAEAILVNPAVGRSIFKEVVDAYELSRKLGTTLSKKPVQSWCKPKKAI